MAMCSFFQTALNPMKLTYPPRTVMPGRLLSPRYRVKIFVYLIVIFLFSIGSAAGAQGNCYDPDSGEYAHGDIEIGLYIHDDAMSVNVKIYDGESGVLIYGPFLARGDNRLLRARFKTVSAG